MTDLYTKGSSPFATIQRGVLLTPDWPGVTSTPDEQRVRCTGPINLDLYGLTQSEDDFVGILAREVERAGVLLYGWDDEKLQEFRSAVWRSAHKYVVDHVQEVDRSRELTELAKILKVDL